MRLELQASSLLGVPLLRMRCHIDLEDQEADWILDRHTWRYNEGVYGLRYFAQRWGCERGGWDVSLDSPGFSTADAMRVNGRRVELGQGQPRNYGGPSIDFVYGESICFALWRDESQPDAYIRATVQRGDTPECLAVTDQIWQQRSQSLSSPWLNLLVRIGPINRIDALNYWTRIYDYFGSRFRKAAGVPMPEPVPSLFLESWNYGSGRFLKHQMAQLDEIASRGITRLMLHTLPHPHFERTCCALYDYTILETEGGMKQLRLLTDEAKKRGMEVWGWSSGHLQVDAPLLKENPDWIVRDESGRVFDGGYPRELAALDFAHPGVQQWYINSLRDLYVKGGIAGFWIDSLMNLHAYGINAKRSTGIGGPGPHLAGLLSCLRTLEREGLQFVTEGIGVIGLSAGNIGRGFLERTAATGNIDIDALGGGAELRYRTSLWWRGEVNKAGDGLDSDKYFEALAHAAPLVLWDDTTDGDDPSAPWLETPVLEPVKFPGYADMNRAYAAVLPFMKVRELLGDGSVLWHPESAASDDLSSDHTRGPEGVTGDRVLFQTHDGTVQLGQAYAGWQIIVVYGDAHATQVNQAGTVSVTRCSILRITPPSRP